MLSAARWRERLLNYYPLLFALYPVLALYNANIYRLRPDELVVPLAVAIAGAAFLTLLFTVLYRSPYKGAAAATLCTLLIFSYEYARLFIAGTFHVILRHQHMLALFAALLAGGLLILAVTRRELRKLAVALSVTGLCLVAMAAGGIVIYTLQQPPTISAPPAAGIRAPLPPPTDAGLPDIYYVILDRYAGEMALRGISDFPNDEFYQTLAQRGFARAPRASANYPKTYLSVASSLNLDYLDNLRTAPEHESTDRQPAFARIQDHTLQRYLRNHGYRYIHIGSRWPQTAANIHADVNMHPDLPDLLSFGWKLYTSTLLNPLGERYFDLSEDGIARRRIRYNFAALGDVAAQPGPKFIFAHILLPHPPYVFGPNGEPRSRREMHGQDPQTSYLNHVRCANLFVIDAVDRILARSARPPLIILQADEGSFSHPEFGGDDQKDGAGINWLTLSDTALVSHLSILTAVRFPEGGAAGLYDTITPVNTLRLAVNRACGAKFPMLPDYNYIFPDTKHIYGFVDVSDRIRCWQPPPSP